MPVDRSAILALAVGLTAIAATALLQRRPETIPMERVVPPESRTAEASSRISYPVNAYPKLQLPNGEQEIVRSVLNIRQKMEYGDFVWDDDGVPAGPVWVRIDLAHQLLSVFRAGHEIGSAVIIYGADMKETPGGVFPILAKSENYRSITYDQPMPFMLRLTPDGVAIHAASIRKGAATHGCVGIPYDFASLLFRQMKVGDIVAIEAPGKAAHS